MEETHLDYGADPIGQRWSDERLDGWQRLCRAMLESALQDLEVASFRWGKRTLREAQAARDWFLDPDSGLVTLRVKHHPKFPPLYHLKFPPPDSSLPGWLSAPN
jgi:hypothetical protein